MTVVKQAGVVVGLISAVVGLVFLFFPGLRPERSSPSPDQSAAIGTVRISPRISKSNFLDLADRTKVGLTKAQLAQLGASGVAEITIVGHKGENLTLERQVFDTRTGRQVNRARSFVITPSRNRVQQPWLDWVPLRPGRVSYVMVFKLLDEQKIVPIACGQSAPFGGLGGRVSPGPLRVCAAS